MSCGVTLLRCVYELASSHLCAYDSFLFPLRSTRLGRVDPPTYAGYSLLRLFMIDDMYTLPQHMHLGGECLAIDAGRQVMSEWHQYVQTD